MDVVNVYGVKSVPIYSVGQQANVMAYAISIPRKDWQYIPHQTITTTNITFVPIKPKKKKKSYEPKMIFLNKDK